MDTLLLVIAALFLVVLNGFFVAAEFSLVKLRQTRVQELSRRHGLRGRILAKVHAHLDAYLSACQLGITLASLGLGWIGEPAFARLITPLLSALNIDKPHMVQGIAFFIAFFIISFLHIVVGELAPKSVALRQAEKVSIWTATPLYGFYWLMFPAIRFLNSSANQVLTWAGLSSSSHHDVSYSADEIKLILRGGQDSGKFTRDEWNVMAHSLDFAELEVSDLMRPISEVTALYQDRDLAENLEVVYQTRFSRYPYFASDERTVLGIIYLKDLFLAQQHGKPITSLSDCAVYSAGCTRLDPVSSFSHGCTALCNCGL